MAFQIQYKSLCEVTFQHGFYLNKGSVEFDNLTEPEKQRRLAAFDLSNNLRLFVPPDTERTLAGLGCLLKATKTGFQIATEVNQSGDVFLPVRVPSRAFKLLLVMESRDPNFWNYTNSKFDGSRQVIYLSNRAGDFGGGFPDLALPPQSHKPDTRYAAGSVVRNEGGEVFLSIRSDKNELDPPNDQKWIKLGKRNYVSDTDEVTLRPLVFMYPPPRGMKKITKVVAKDQDEKEVPVKVAFPSPGPQVSIDASQLSSGFYKLQVTGEDAAGDPAVPVTEQIYLAPELIGKNVVAIIELFHWPGDAIGEKFRLYDEANGFALRQPNFMVRLLNRHTFWRYQFRKPLENPGEDDDLDKDLVTKMVMPLTRDVQDVSFRGTKLPNPSVTRVVPENNRVFSDVQIHINP